MSDQQNFAPCPTCGQYSHSIGEDRLAAAYNHFQSMFDHRGDGIPTQHWFDERTRDAAEVLLAAIRPRMELDDMVDRLAATMAACDRLNWFEQCAYEADPDAHECGSPTCVAAHYEDHDADVARGNYRQYASAALAILQSADLPADVVELVFAAREVAFGGLFDGAAVADPEARAALKRLDTASEAFASRVRWEDEPEGEGA